MICKRCGANTIVVDGVDNRDADETYRERVCPKCGISFYTVEFPVRITPRFIHDWKTNHRKHKDVSIKYYTPYGIKNLFKEIKKSKSNKIRKGVKNDGRNH